MDHLDSNNRDLACNVNSGLLMLGSLLFYLCLHELILVMDVFRSLDFLELGNMYCNWKDIGMFVWWLTGDGS